MALSIAMPLDFAAGRTHQTWTMPGDGVATGSDDPAVALAGSRGSGPRSRLQKRQITPGTVAVGTMTESGSDRLGEPGPSYGGMRFWRLVAEQRLHLIRRILHAPAGLDATPRKAALGLGLGRRGTVTTQQETFEPARSIRCPECALCLQLAGEVPSKCEVN